MDDLAALRLQLEWGADEAIGDVAIDRFAPAPLAVPRARPDLAAPRPARTAISAASPGPDPAEAATLDALLASWAAFDGCSLRTTATQFVRPDGNPSAPLVIIGDAPGSEDDRSGRAFSGPDGHTIDRVLGTIGIDRQTAFLFTLVPWRPPGGRRPSDNEIQACLPFLQRLLGLVRPRHVLLLGTQAARVVAGQDAPLRRLRGKWMTLQVEREQLTMTALALPAADQWLANAATKQSLWSDLILLHQGVTTG